MVAADQNWHVIIDTPKGDRSKFKYDSELGLFKWSKQLAAGHVFPYNFGFIPGTLGEDGDCLDVLLIFEEPLFVGCMVVARPVGVILAMQSQKKRMIRNDRLVAVAVNDESKRSTHSLSELPRSLIEEIQHFFVSYNEMDGKKFTPLGVNGPRKAHSLVKLGMEKFQKRGIK